MANELEAHLPELMTLTAAVLPFGLADAFAICFHTVLCILHSCCFGDTMRKYDYREKRKNNVLQDASHAE